MYLPFLDPSYVGLAYDFALIGIVTFVVDIVFPDDDELDDYDEDDLD